MSYEELVISRICAPLGMESTRITLAPSMKERLARGHDANLAPVANWDIPTLAGAGALRSTANDLFTFLDMSMGNKRTLLADALAMTLGERRSTGLNGRMWRKAGSSPRAMTKKLPGRMAVPAATQPSSAFRSRHAAQASFCPMRPITPPIRARACISINAAYPLPKLRRQVPVDPQILTTYAGHYELTPNFVLTVRADGGRLFVQATKQQEYRGVCRERARFFLSRGRRPDQLRSRLKAAWRRR